MRVISSIRCRFDIRAVERADVPEDILARRGVRDLDVTSRHRDVVEEDVAAGVATGRGQRSGQEMADARVGSGLEHQHRRAWGQLAAIDADIVIGWVDDQVVRVEDAGVLLPGHRRATGRAEVRVDRVAVTALGTDDALGQRRLASALHERQVGGRTEQAVDLTRIGHLDHTEPALAIRVVVDPLGGVSQVGVHVDDDAADGRVDVGHRLGGLDLAERLAGLHRGTSGRHLDVHDVAERVLRVVGDADAGARTLDLDPFVVGRVAEVLRHVHGR